VFTPFWGRVYESPRIGGKLRAISALGTAHSRRCGYCIAHMSESARRAGINDAELAAIAQGDANKLLSTRERAALQYATELSGQSGEAHESIRILEGHFDDGEIVNITLAVGLYNLTSLFLQSLRIEVDDALRR
jgi:AhpD family alkylhydroperoxidase